jgi:hypothetical protein
MAQISKFSLMSMINGLKLPLDVKLHVWEKNVLINNPTKLISNAKIFLSSYNNTYKHPKL